MKRIVPSLLGLALLLASCGQDPQPDTTKPTVTLVSSKASVTAAESIKLTATATDNIGVTRVEFYDGATKLGEDSSSPYEFDVALTVANNGSRSYKAKAFDAANNEGSSGAVAVMVAIAPTITVTGTVINDAGFRVAGAKVLLNNSDLRTTDINGSFTYNSATVPYDLTVAYDSKVFVSNGLTRSDPLIVRLIAFNRTTASGEVTGPTYPLPAGNRIVFGSTGGSRSSGVSGSDGQFSADIQWGVLLGATTVDLGALLYSFTTGSNGSNEVITNFLQTGKRTEVTLSSGMNQSNLGIALDTPVAVSNATLIYSLGAYSSGSTIASLNSVTVGGLEFSLRIPISSGVATKIPIEGGSFALNGTDSAGNSVFANTPAVVGGSTAINLSNTTTISNINPASNATNVSKTSTFTWNSLPGATAYIIFLGISGGDGSGQFLSGSYSIYLPGTSNSYTIPDFAGITDGLQPGKNYSWGVYGIRSTNFTPDALTEPSQSLLLKLNSGLIGFESYTSKVTSFTTAP